MSSSLAAALLLTTLTGWAAFRLGRAWERVDRARVCPGLPPTTICHKAACTHGCQLVGERR